EGEEDLIVGKSQEIVEIAKLIGQVAPTDASVLVMGESGTGKELVARAIHRNSLRKDKPFLSVNCAALPEALLESELFGYEKGAFTGAYQRKLGKFEQGDKGTIFLDEIADMSLMTQSKVLRVLQEQEFERVGGNQSTKVDVRIIAATNKSLVNCIKEGNFRVDLFYRLKVVSIYLPPLRERKSDIPLLADYFLKKYARLISKNVEGISDSGLKVLQKYPWPGNVRELENNIHTAVVMSKGGLLLPEHFPIYSENRERLEIDFEKVKKDYTKVFSEILEPIFSKILANSDGHIYDHLEEALERTVFDLSLKYCQGNQVKTSELLGVSRNTLRDRMKKFGLF
ncbi:MAG: sigma-54 dependent transcriptional regulator, partial [candidate division Zixibacteria bacterium]|nr:sigma-54 dependent transcriptional regulator [candidate division Zixibacteria bacterium]